MASPHPAASHTADAVVLHVADGVLETLLWQRAEDPDAGAWALPGGYLGPTETLEASVRRHLREKVGLREVGHLEQLETRSEPTRDPRGWTVTTAYLALVAGPATVEAPPDTAWHPAGTPPPLAFDHADLLDVGTERLRAKLTYSNIAFALVAETFSVTDLRRTYAGVLGYHVSPTNLQRVLERGGLIEATGERRPAGAGGGRPAELFRFRHDTLTIPRPLVAFRPAAGRR